MAVVKAFQLINQLLGPPYGKGWDDDRSSPPGGIHDDLHQFFHALSVFRMIPIPVGGFHDQIIGTLDDGGVSEQGPVHVAQVSGKDQLGDVVIFFGPELHDGRTQNMAGIVKDEPDLFIQRNQLVVENRLDQFQGFLCVLDRIQRLNHRFIASLCLLVGPLGFLFMNVGTVPQHDSQQVRCGIGTIDRAPVSPLYQQGQPTAVVDVGMAQNDIINFFRIKGKGFSVQGLQRLVSLELAAVDEELMAVGGNQMTRTGNTGCSATEFYFHTSGPPLRHFLHYTPSDTKKQWKG